jgi:O-antigen ligase
LSSIGRQRSIALFGVGLLVPLLGGGNVLVSLEPDLAIHYLAAVILAFTALTATSPRRVGRYPKAATIALAVLVFWWGGTLALRPSGPRAALEAEGLFCAALLFAVFSWKPLRGSDMRAWIVGLIAGTLLTAGYGQYQYWIMFPRTAPLIAAMGGSPRLYVNANFYNSNCYAAFIAVVLLLAVAVVPKRHRRGRAVAFALAVSMLVVTLFLSESRSTLVLLIAGGVALALGLRLPIPWRWAVPVLSLTLAAAAWTIVNKVGFAELWHEGWLGRLAIWQGSLRMIREHWLVGVGLGRFWDYFEQYRINTYYTRYPHNFLLEVFADLGVVGGGALLTWLVLSYGRTIRLWRRIGSLPTDGVDLRGGTAVVVAIGLLVAHALLDIDWHAPANPILLFALLGIGQHLDELDESAVP